MDADEPQFRSNKVRRVARRRRRESTEAEDPDALSDAIVRSDPVALGDDDAVRLPKTIRRSGITFSSSMARSEFEKPFPVANTTDRTTTSRPTNFVQATGPAIVAEDKQMSAFVDARMAELRCKDIIPEQRQQQEAREGTSNRGEEGNSDILAQRSATVAPADREKKRSKIMRPPRGRRKRHEPSEADVARDQLVDQIMKEGALPVYDRSEQSQPLASDLNRDVAVATAFKRDFLADLEDKKHLRRPPPQAQATAVGPKLGGSRVDREKMRSAAEKSMSSK